MQSEVIDPIDEQVHTRRAELAEMPINDVRQEYETMFGIRADLSAAKESLIDRVLAKVRAELRRNA
jgi:hypothetical protein